MPEKRRAFAVFPTVCATDPLVSDMPGRVLLVEDDPDTSSALEGVLTYGGWEIKTVADGIRAIRMLYEWQPDLMLLDLMLPGMDGYQICRLIKNDSSLRDLPVVMLTARTLPEEIRYGIEIGADEYITKPFDVHDLIARMENVLARKTGRLKDREIVDPFAGKNDLEAATAIILRVNRLLDAKLMELSRARSSQKETEGLLRNRINELKRLQEVALSVSANLDLDQTLRHLARAVKEGLNVDRVRIFLVDDGQVVLRLNTDAGDAAGALDDRSGILAHVLENRRPLLVRNASGDGSEGVGSDSGPFALAPMHVRDEPIGVLAVGNNITRRAIPNQQLESLTAFANHAAVVIQNARLFRDLANTYQNLKENQQQFVQAAKLLSVGDLVAGIAHELNQPLTVIRGFAQWIRKRTGPADRYYEELGMIEECTTRMMKIINHLRAFAGGSERADGPVQVDEILENALLLTAERLKVHGVQIVVDYGESLPCVIGDANQLEQAFLGLISNAQEAMEKTGGGTLKIATRWVSEEDHPESPGYTEISISDTGEGIPEEIQDRVFDPFFTTKEVGKGMGLGLSTCYGIVREHRGEIRVHSRPGYGTTFTILLPAASLTESSVNRR